VGESYKTLIETGVELTGMTDEQLVLLAPSSPLRYPLIGVQHDDPTHPQ
jgi:hypothetical protein